VCPYKRGATQGILFFLSRAALGHRLVVKLILDLAGLELRLPLLCSMVVASLSSKIPSSPSVLRWSSRRWHIFLPLVLRCSPSTAMIHRRRPSAFPSQAPPTSPLGHPRWDPVELLLRLELVASWLVV
jgi:hypothetical protein